MVFKSVSVVGGRFPNSRPIAKPKPLAVTLAQTSTSNINDCDFITNNYFVIIWWMSQ